MSASHSCRLLARRRSSAAGGLLIGVPAAIDYGIFSSPAIVSVGTDRFTAATMLALLFVGTRYSLTIGVLGGAYHHLSKPVVGLVRFTRSWVDSILRSVTGLVLNDPQPADPTVTRWRIRSPSIRHGAPARHSVGPSRHDRRAQVCRYA